uniref:24 kDa family member n=1 Tax=Rhipicephalus zambeziensis TaxID=60191 RepID=A0A224Y0R2_9ACAR
MRCAQIFLLVFLLTVQCSLQANGEETSGKESAYDTDNCIEITLPNILQLDECLGDNLNLCKGKTTLTEGVLSLANCTVSGVVRNLSPMRALVTIKDLLVALLGKLIPPLGDLLSSVQLFALFESGKIEDNVCHGEVKITVPNSLGKCVDDTLKLCKEGTTIDISLVESLGKTVGCLVKDLFTNTPQDTVSGLLCDIARLLSTVLGQIPGGGILSKPIEQMCKSN